MCLIRRISKINPTPTFNVEDLNIFYDLDMNVYYKDHWDENCEQAMKQSFTTNTKEKKFEDTLKNQLTST